MRHCVVSESAAPLMVRGVSPRLYYYVIVEVASADIVIVYFVGRKLCLSYVFPSSTENQKCVVRIDDETDLNLLQLERLPFSKSHHRLLVYEYIVLNFSTIKQR